MCPLSVRIGSASEEDSLKNQQGESQLIAISTYFAYLNVDVSIVPVGLCKSAAFEKAKGSSI